MIDEFMNDPGAAPGLPPAKVIDRNPPDVSNARRELVSDWIKRIEEGEAHWDKTFKTMRKDAAFAAGTQWRGPRTLERYTANITLRHINQRVSSIYAKNPRVRADRKEKIWFTQWDGTEESKAEAEMVMQQVALNPALAEQMGAEMLKAQAILQEI